LNGHLSNYSSRQHQDSTQNDAVSSIATTSASVNSNQIDSGQGNATTNRNSNQIDDGSINTRETDFSLNNTNLKLKFQKDSFECLQNILLVQDKIFEIIDKKVKIEEQHLIVEPSKLKPRTCFIYNQFLKVPAFKSFFDDDAPL
jgi:hypothetical protein